MLRVARPRVTWALVAFPDASQSLVHCLFNRFVVRSEFFQGSNCSSTVSLHWGLSYVAEACGTTPSSRAWTICLKKPVPFAQGNRTADVSADIRREIQEMPQGNVFSCSSRQDGKSQHLSVDIHGVAQQNPFHLQQKRDRFGLHAKHIFAKILCLRIVTHFQRNLANCQSVLRKSG